MFRLRDFRRDANLTQKDVAVLFECAQSNIAAIEKEGKDLMAAQLDVLNENYGKELVVSYMSPDEPKESEEEKGAIPMALSAIREKFDVKEDRLLAIIESQQRTIETLSQTNKKILVQVEDNVTCADAAGSEFKK